MSDNAGKEETSQAEQQDLVNQQQDLFRELSREQTEAEKALEADQSQDESDE